MYSLRSRRVLLGNCLVACLVYRINSTNERTSGTIEVGDKYISRNELHPCRAWPGLCVANKYFTYLTHIFSFFRVFFFLSFVAIFLFSYA
jgi:hypothetical protein